MVGHWQEICDWVPPQDARLLTGDDELFVPAISALPIIFIDYATVVGGDEDPQE